MKNKLRKITINQLVYFYVVSDKYHLGTETNTLTIKIYLVGFKQTPLIIEFLTIEHYYVGQVLKSGVLLLNKKTNTSDRINLNEPKHIRELILIGIKKGWTGVNKLEIQNGLSYLNELGYDTEILVPSKK
jgi:hypothetical protein